MQYNITNKQRLRMEIAIRLELANPGLSAVDIAAHIGLTPAGYASMRNRQEFKVLYNQIASGVVSQLDAELATEASTLRKRFIETSLPPALQKLRDALYSKDEKISLRAAESITEMSGFFPKTTTVVVNPDIK